MEQPSPSEYKRRLRVLSDLLWDLDEGRFRFDTWVGPDWDGAPNLSCGTVACGLGWATTIPEFQAMGLRLVRDDDDDVDDPGGYVVFDGVAEGHGPYTRSLQAAMTLFGLSFQEAELMFTPGHRFVRGLPTNIKPRQLAAVIRDFIDVGIDAFSTERLKSTLTSVLPQTTV